MQLQRYFFLSFVPSFCLLLITAAVGQWPNDFYFIFIVAAALLAQLICRPAVELPDRAKVVPATR